MNGLINDFATQQFRSFHCSFLCCCLQRAENCTSCSNYQIFQFNRELKQRRRRRQRERQKGNRLDEQNNNFARASRLFCTFLSRRCAAATWTCLISRFVEDGNTRQQLSFSFPELWYSPSEFNSTYDKLRWNKRDNVWGTVAVVVA